MYGPVGTFHSFSRTANGRKLQRYFVASLVNVLAAEVVVVVAFGLVLVAVLLVVGAKGALVYGLSRLLGVPGRTAALAGLALAQSGEFSFLLARVGVDAPARCGAADLPKYSAIFSGDGWKSRMPGWVSRDRASGAGDSRRGWPAGRRFG